MPLAARRSPGPDLPAVNPSETTGVPVLLVTSDDMLWAQFSAAVPDVRLEQHDTVPDLVSAWDPSRAAVVVIDARVDADLTARLQELREHSQRLVPVALVDDRTAQAVMKFGLAGALHGQILDTFDPARTHEVLTRSREEAQARSVADGDASAAAPSAVRTPPPAGRAVSLIAGGIAVAMIIVAAATWWRHTPPAAPVTAAAPAPTTVAIDRPALPAADATAAPDAIAAPAAAPAPDAPQFEAHATATPDDLESLLGEARRAMRDKQYTEPENANALGYFNAALALDPANGEARQGIDRIAEVLIGRAEVALTARDFPAAMRALELARNIRPDNPRIAALDAQVGQRQREYALTQIEAALQANSFERGTALLKQAEHAGSVTPAQAEQLRDRLTKRQAAFGIANLIRLTQTRLSQGRLLQPENDSARYYLAELTTSGGPESATDIARLRGDFLHRLQTEARAAASQGRWPDVEALLGELRTDGAPAPQLATLEAELTQTREQARIAAAAREAAAAAATARAAAAKAAPAESIKPPHLARALSVKYPTSARVSGKQGWVDVEFMVNVSGTAEGVRVAAADPAREFDAAALEAVRQARFEPARTADGTAVEMPGRLRVRFALDSAK
jgi:TonB family protein